MADIPIVDVPITGGIQWGSSPYDFGGKADDPGGGDEWHSYEWFDPIGLFCADPTVPEDDCQYWCRMCGMVVVPELVNTATLPHDVLSVPSFSPANIEGYGICQIFWIWMWSYYLGQKGVITDPPPPLVSGPGTGGGGHGGG